MLSQYVEERYVTTLLEHGAEGVGYLLKDRVAEVERSSTRSAGSPRAAPCSTPRSSRTCSAGRRQDDRSTRSPTREREVLGLMAEGRTNRAISETMFVSERAVERHVTAIFGKLGLPTTEQDHRRVLAVLAYLRGT